MSVRFAGKLIFSDNRHGWPLEQAPRPNVTATYFWGTGGESHILGGRGARGLIVNGILGGPQFNDQKKFSEGLEKLHELIANYGRRDLVVSAGGTTRSWRFVYLANVEPIPQPGQRLPVPLPDVVGGTVGPAGGGYWMELNLHFVQPSL